MLDLSTIVKRHWDVKLPNGLFLSVGSPKLKTLRKITDLAKDEENIVENLCAALAMALSKNKQGKKVTAEFIEDNFDLDNITELLTSYFEWVKAVKNDPNYKSPMHQTMAMGDITN